MIRKSLYWVPIISIILTPIDTLRGFVTPMNFGRYIPYFHEMCTGLQIWIIIYIFKGIL